MVPRAIVVLEQLPLNANGKVDRKALPDAGGLLAGGRAFEPPRGEAETMLADLWRELLDAPQVGRHDNFFELGGDSILCLQLLARLRSARPAAARIALADVMQAADLAALALRWQQCSEGAQAPASHRMAPSACRPAARACRFSACRA